MAAGVATAAVMQHGAATPSPVLGDVRGGGLILGESERKGVVDGVARKRVRRRDAWAAMRGGGKGDSIDPHDRDGGVWGEAEVAGWSLHGAVGSGGAEAGVLRGGCCDAGGAVLRLRGGGSSDQSWGLRGRGGGHRRVGNAPGFEPGTSGGGSMSGSEGALEGRGGGTEGRAGGVEGRVVDREERSGDGWQPLSQDQRGTLT